MKKKLIRQGVFETNSSSSHSVSIGVIDGKEFVLDSIYPDQYGNVTLEGGEYGWDWFKTNDPLEKANYAAQQFMNNDYNLEILKEVILDMTDAEDVIFKDLDNGYVDHDSVGILPTNSSELKDFIFNKNSWLFGGNDNSSPDPMFYDVPEIKNGKQILPTYYWEISLIGDVFLKKTTKLKEKNLTDEYFNEVFSSFMQDVIYEEHGIYGLRGNSWSSTDTYYVYNYNCWVNYKTKEFVMIRTNSRISIWDLEKELREMYKDFNERDDANELLFHHANELSPGTFIKLKFNLEEIKWFTK